MRIKKDYIHKNLFFSPIKKVSLQIIGNFLYFQKHVEKLEEG